MTQDSPVLFALLSVYVLMMALALWEARLDTPSDARARRRRWAPHLILALINASLVTLTPLSAVALAGLAQTQGLGLLNWADAPIWLSAAVTVLALSAAQYAVHRAHHEIPILWRLHRVHHCDTTPDGTSAIRHHPLEVLLAAAAYGIVVLALGPSPIVVALVGVLDLTFAILTHSSLRLPAQIERVAARLFVTPLVHRVHHSDDQRETDTNYGNTFTLWDQLFGTFRPAPLRSASTFRAGLKGITAKDASNLDYLIALPFKPQTAEHQALAKQRR